jgi:hypothetical protein
MEIFLFQLSLQPVPLNSFSPGTILSVRYARDPGRLERLFVVVFAEAFGESRKLTHVNFKLP